MFTFREGDRVVIDKPWTMQHGERGTVVEVNDAVDAALVSTETSTIWISRFNLVTDEG